MYRRKFFALIIVLAIFYPLLTQDVPLTSGNFYDVTEGAMYRHIYSTSVYIVPTSATSTTTVTATGTIAGDIFDST